ncbi:MAG: hypothetical protein KDE05_12170 [Parvularculaceae bacterium]|nr:hypothetical protein [Parvularculaceae bacterium]
MSRRRAVARFPCRRLVLLAALAGLAACAQEKNAAADLPEFCYELPRPGWVAVEKLRLRGQWFDV